MKEWIREGLARDSEFSDVVVEGNWTGALTGERRRPDVRAMYRGLPIVFEVQLSSTYLNVIAERRVFYLQEGALLVWVFAEFDDQMRKLTQDGWLGLSRMDGSHNRRRPHCVLAGYCHAHLATAEAVHCDTSIFY